MLATQTTSFPVWRQFALPQFDPLDKNTAADTCVIGAGIAGLSTAYLLASAGRSVVVIDAASLGGGETERTTAHVTDVLDKRYYELEWLHGEGGARLAAASHRAAIAKIEAIIDEEQIECEFQHVDGYLFDPSGASDGSLEEERKAARRAGIPVEFVDHAPLGSFGTGPALRFPTQAQFHPLKYLAGLAAAIVRKGGRIFSRSQVKSVAGAQPVVIETAARQVSAKSCIVATNTPINDRFAMHTKQAAYRTYVVGLRLHNASLTPALYWDTAEPYHYVRVHSEKSGDAARDLLIVGGEDHKTGQEDDPELRYLRLEQWAAQRFPTAGELDFRWSGQVIEPNDGLAYIGRNPGDENVYIVTGTSGNGMTYGTIAGILLTDLIAGRENPWAGLYSPSRVSLRAVGQFLRENLNAAAWYTAHLTRGDVDSPDAVAPGTGAIVRRRLSKVAVYRDKTGTLHEYSAVCPHLGGIVRWNHAEQSWDCPLHGSRFTALGSVLNGPAISDLKNADNAHS